MRVAGRLHARRGQGKMAFLDLDDRSGRIQLQARRDVLGDEVFERLLAADLGDLIGADGTIFKTRRGELSVAIGAWELLAKSLRPPPEKHHGLTDTETRLRHRELDLMSNEETRAVFITRAKVVTAIRRFLDDEGFIEVETPVLQPIYGGALARPFVTHFNALDRTMYLRVATELYLKRLIVGGLERVYEIGKDFRNEGLSPKHNPEFTMLEWYEAYADWEVVAERAERLVRSVAEAVGSEKFAQSWKRETLVGSIQTRTGIDVLAHRDLEDLKAAMRDKDLPVPEEPNWAALVDHLVSKHVEPTLSSRRCCTTIPSSSLRSPSVIARTPTWSSGLRRSRTEWSSPTPSPSSTIRTTRRPVSRSRSATPRPATRTPRRSIPTTSTRSSTGCRRPAASASGSTVWSCC